MSLSTDVTGFVIQHTGHGPVTAEVAGVTPTGYNLVITCRCGASFAWVVMPKAAAGDLALQTRLN